MTVSQGPSALDEDHTKLSSFFRSHLRFKIHPKCGDRPPSRSHTDSSVLRRRPRSNTVHLPGELWEEIIKYLEKPELHAISKVSAILRDVALPFVFYTARFDAKDGTSLRYMAEAYVDKRAVRKNITELHLDYQRAIDDSRGKFWATIGVMWSENLMFRGIESNRMSRLTTLVLHKVVVVEVWIECILKSQTLRRLHLDACVCYQWPKSFPSTKVTEIVIQDAQYSRELEALIIFLAPQLEVLEVHSANLGLPEQLPTIFPETCPRLRKYVLRLPISGGGPFIAPLREFLIRTTTIEVLELSMGFSSDTLPLPSSALPNLRLYDTTLSTGLPAIEFITGPRKLSILRLRDDFVHLDHLDSVGGFLQVPYDVASLHLTLHQHKAERLLALSNRDIWDIEKLHRDMKSNQPSVLDVNAYRNHPPLTSILIWVSRFVTGVKPVCPDDTDRSRGPSSHELKKIYVDIDVDSIETTPHEFEKWFNSMVATKCPALKEAYFKVWKVNNQGARGAEPTLWARWRMGIDNNWCYEGGYISKHESP